MTNTTEKTYYVEEERLLALELSVKFWGMVAQNPKSNPTTEKRVLETADRFYDWLVRT